jgi:hypothetical protein
LMVFSRKKLGIVAAPLLVLGSLLLGACGSAPAPPGTAPASSPPSVATTGSTPNTLGATVFTTSTTLLFPSQKLFMQELSGDGYQTAIVSTDRGEGTVFTIVWIAVDPDKVTPATHDAIFDQAVTLAQRYGAADSTEGRLRVELFDSTQGGSIKDLIIESRDFDLRSPPPIEPSTATTQLYPAVDNVLGQLRLDVNPREGVRVAIGGLREIPADTPDPRKRLIEGEIIIENRSDTPFVCGPDDFRLHVGPFQTQIQGLTASTDFPVRDAVLAPSPVEGHPFMTEGAVQPGDTLHGYLLTWVADRGTASSGLQYDPSDPDAAERGFGFEIQP